MNMQWQVRLLYTDKYEKWNRRARKYWNWEWLSYKQWTDSFIFCPDSQSCWEKSNQFGFWSHQAMKPRSFSKSLFINLKMWPDFRKQWAPARSHSLQCKWLLGYSRSSQLLKISLSMCVTYKINSIGRCEVSHKIKSIWPGIMHNSPFFLL